LYGADLDERLLQRVEPVASAQTLDGQDAPFDHLTHRGETGAYWLPVEEHCAGAAFALVVATLFGASQTKIVSQDVE
jgi:hypothetical protein